MSGLPNFEIDPYDDNFSSLSEFFSEQRAPNFIKTASVMDEKVLQRLPDHAFAVVMLDKGKCLRKYACVDKAHTAVNVLYLIKNAESLPEKARIKAATNLIAACNHFDLDVPPNLNKLAATKKRLIKTDGADVITSVKGREKEADLIGSSVMPVSGKASSVKLSSVMSDPYVDVEGCQNVRSTVQTTYDPAVCALEDGRLPLEDFNQVKEAIDFFGEYSKELHPRMRHSMCVKIASRANQLGIEVPYDVDKYGALTYASPGLLKAGVETRKQIWASLEEDGTGPGLLNKLLEKRASISPDEFAEALSELDVVTGIDRYWDSGVQDPWYTTFGVQKLAADESDWRYRQGTEYLTKEQLENFVNNNNELLTKKFGEPMAEGLRDNTTAVFDSLPMDTKRVISRMAQQQEGL
ncbi:MAG: hypothetical protein ACXAEU_22940 [Candidatus Hodarchaeales archaeon]|jgi:hypothetical protein